MSIIGIVGNMALDQSVLRARMDVVSRQVSTGQRGTVHGALGPEARRAIDLRGEVARREAYDGAANRALARSGAAQTVLARLHELASEVKAETLRAKPLGATGVQALATTARAAMEEVAALLNSRHDGEYLFGGSDVSSPPVPGAAGIADGPMATAIAGAVATLDATNAATVLADTAIVASDPTTTPFSAYLEGAGASEARRAVQVADGERVQVGVFANRDSTGEVTASWGRELLRGLATLAALTPVQAEDGVWRPLLDGVTAGLDGAVAALSVEQGTLGTAEQRMELTRTRHKDTMVALRAQLGAIEEIDLAEASAALSQLRSRLEASYQATGMIARLSLASLLR